MSLLLLLIIIFPFTVSAVTQADYDELLERVKQIENNQKNILDVTEEPKPKVNSYLNDNLTLGGFFDGGFTFLAGPDTETQLTTASNIVGLNISASFDRRLRFVSQFVTALQTNLQNRHNDPNATTLGLPKTREFSALSSGIVPTQGYVEYTISRMLHFQGGLGYVPFGFVLQVREPVLFVRRGAPQMVRSSNIVPPLWSGLHIHGSKSLENFDFGYNLYTFLPDDHTKFLGTGGRVWFSSNDDKIIGGFSSQLAKNDEETYEVLGADLRLDYFPYQLRTEIAQVFQRGQDSWTTYFEPGVFVYNEEILLYVFGDYLYGANNETGGGRNRLADPIQRLDYGGGVNWLPTSYTRVRLGLTYSDYLGNRAVVDGINRDYVTIDLSVGIAF